VQKLSFTFSDGVDRTPDDQENVPLNEDLPPTNTSEVIPSFEYPVKVGYRDSL
jgi:hypothetical protein